MNQQTQWQLGHLPLSQDVETRAILKKLPAAHAALAQLKELSKSIPNQNVLLNTLILREAKESSAIENIITTHDELYLQELDLGYHNSKESKEVQDYAVAVRHGFRQITEQRILRNKAVIKLYQIIKKNNAGFRTQSGTVLKNDLTQEIVYTPPSNPEQIKDLMANWLEYFNGTIADDLDPLVRMAILHHQFESIHPFYDGNGRAGRILNVLYLILVGLQDLPILYLSKYLITQKSEYYRLLQSVRDTNDWEEWISYIIDAVQITAIETIELISQIKKLMRNTENLLKENYKFYSQDLVNALFMYPYTKIEQLAKLMSVNRDTAGKYLNRMAKDGILGKEKIGKSNYYINRPFYQLLITN